MFLDLISKDALQHKSTDVCETFPHKSLQQQGNNAIGFPNAPLSLTGDNNPLKLATFSNIAIT